MSSFGIPFKMGGGGVGWLGFVQVLFVCFLILNITKMSSVQSPSHNIIKEQKYLPCRVNPVVINISSDSYSAFSKEEKSSGARAKTEILPLEALSLLIFMQASGCSPHLRQKISPKNSFSFISIQESPGQVIILENFCNLEVMQSIVEPISCQNPQPMWFPQRRAFCDKVLCKVDGTNLSGTL